MCVCTSDSRTLVNSTRYGVVYVCMYVCLSMCVYVCTSDSRTLANITRYGVVFVCMLLIFSHRFFSSCLPPFGCLSLSSLSEFSDHKIRCVVFVCEVVRVLFYFLYSYFSSSAFLIICISYHLYSAMMKLSFIYSCVYVCVYIFVCVCVCLYMLFDFLDMVYA
jgi:hypothetical protein